VTKKKIQEALQALREGFQKAGRPIDELTLDFARKMAKDPRFQRIVSTRPEQTLPASVAAGVLCGLEKSDETSAEQWERNLERIRHELPYRLRSELGPRMKAALKNLPKRPSTGRTVVLKPRDQKRATKLVSKYHHDGDSMRMAYEKVAGEVNCSPRTIQRAWQQRRALRSASKSRSSRLPGS
jgi:hypothetical protein